MFFLGFKFGLKQFICTFASVKHKQSVFINFSTNFSNHIKL